MPLVFVLMSSKKEKDYKKVNVIVFTSNLKFYLARDAETRQSGSFNT